MKMETKRKPEWQSLFQKKQTLKIKNIMRGYYKKKTIT